MQAGTNQVVVTVNGNWFINSPLLRVRVNEQLIIPTFVSTHKLTFLAPDVPEEGPYFVFVTNNGLDFCRGSSFTYLTYYKLFGLTGLSLHKIQIGSSQVISAYGFNLPTTGVFYCVIGKATTSPFLEYYVKATLVSSSEVKCLMPSYFGILSALTLVDFRLSYNN